MHQLANAVILRKCGVTIQLADVNAVTNQSADIHNISTGNLVNASAQINAAQLDRQLTLPHASARNLASELSVNKAINGIKNSANAL